MKAKIHAVTIAGRVMLVWAQTKQGAIRDALEQLGKDATVEVATGEMLYAAGRADMSSHVRERLKSDALRAQVRQRLDAGWSTAQIVKDTGKSYRHIAQLVAQIKAEKEPRT